MSFGRVLISVAVLASADVVADPINVRIFQIDGAEVKLDARLPAGVPVLVHSVDGQKKADNLLNTAVRMRLSEVTPGLDISVAYQEAFRKLQNSSDWVPVYQALMSGGEAVEKAVRYRIAKVPAIVFDDVAVVYGVDSLAEALAIYEQKRGLQ